MLSGGAGKDKLYGRNGKDIVIGCGKGKLKGGCGDDLLIGGSATGHVTTGQNGSVTDRVV